MPTDRCQPGVAVLNKKMYVTGGYDDQDMSSAECYDPDTKTWSQVANMNIARQGHGLVSVNGRLYAFGDWGGVDNVEVYDPDNNTWTLLEHKQESKVSGTGAVAYPIINYIL